MSSPSIFFSDNLKSAVLATARLIIHHHHRRQHGTIADAANDVVLASQTNTRKHKGTQKRQIFKKANIANEQPLYSSSTFLISLNDL